MQSIIKTASRITELRTELGLSQKEFAKRIGITQGALSQLENQKSTLSLSTIVKISKQFNVDCNWLVIGGTESLYRDEEEGTSSALNPKKGFIPLIKEEAHAGYLSQGSDEKYLHSLDAYKIPGFESGDYRLFEIEGDSMMPAIHPREIVVTERRTGESDIENGTLCVLVTQEAIIAKRVYQYAEEPNMLILKSDNPDYKTYSVSIKEVKEIWELKAKITNTISPSNTVSQARMNNMESDILALKSQLEKLKGA